MMYNRFIMNRFTRWIGVLGNRTSVTMTAPSPPLKPSWFDVVLAFASGVYVGHKTRFKD